MEYLTTYPKTISFIDGLKHKIHVDNKGVEQLHIVVKKSFEELTKIFREEGFTKVKLEMHEYKEMGLSVGDKVFLELSKAETLGV